MREFSRRARRGHVLFPQQEQTKDGPFMGRATGPFLKCFLRFCLALSPFLTLSDLPVCCFASSNYSARHGGKRTTGPVVLPPAHPFIHHKVGATVS